MNTIKIKLGKLLEARWRRIGIVVTVSYLLVYIIYFRLLEKYAVPEIWMHCALDDVIPFCEWFVIPYMLWFAYVAGSGVLLWVLDQKRFVQLAAFLFVGMTICMVIYTIIPNGQALRPETMPRDNVLTRLVAWLYQIDSPNNVCPSIHAFNSIGVHIALCHSTVSKKYRWLCPASSVLMVLIILSTMFLKQHSALDVIAAGALALVMYCIVYRVDWKLQKQTIGVTKRM